MNIARIVAVVNLSCGLLACDSPDPAVETTEPPVEEEEAPPEPEQIAVEDPPAPLETACGAPDACHFDNPCTPTRCTSSPVLPTNCEVTLPEPGTCACTAGTCTLHRNDLGAAASADECNAFCALDAAGGTCTPADDYVASPYTFGDAHPSCFCDRRHTPARCAMNWYEPIPCSDTNECWMEHPPGGGVIPARRPPRLRSYQFRPCVDGEAAPMCDNGFCGFSPFVAAC